MEKLYDYKYKDNPEDDCKLYRFQCDCLTPDDAMDIMVDADGKDNEEIFISILMHFEATSLWTRIKYAWQILMGHWHWREFIPRRDDYKELSTIFGKDKYSELP